MSGMEFDLYPLKVPSGWHVVRNGLHVPPEKSFNAYGEHGIFYGKLDEWAAVVEWIESADRLFVSIHRENEKVFAENVGTITDAVNVIQTILLDLTPAVFPYNDNGIKSLLIKLRNIERASLGPSSLDDNNKGMGV